MADGRETPRRVLQTLCQMAPSRGAALLPLPCSRQTLLINVGAFSCRASAPPKKGVVAEALSSCYCFTNQSKACPGTGGPLLPPAFTP